MNRKQGIIFAAALVILIGSFAFWFAHMAKYGSQSNGVLDEKIKAANDKDKAVQDLLEAQKQAQVQAQTQPQAQKQSAATPEDPLADELNDPAEEKPKEDDKEKKKFTSEKLKISLEYDADENLEISEGTNLLTVSKNGKSWKIKFYQDKEKQDFEVWYKDHYGEKDNPGCVYNEGTIKSGDYETKSVEENESEKCEDGGNFIISTDKSKKIKIYKEKETEENINKILAGFKFN